MASSSTLCHPVNIYRPFDEYEDQYHSHTPDNQSTQQNRDEEKEDA